MPSIAPIRIGCIHRDVALPYWATFAQGVSAGARAHNVELCVPYTDPDDDLAAAINEVVHQHPDAVIVPRNVFADFPDVVRCFHAAGIPIIGAELEPNTAFASVVRADEATGTQAVVRCLFDHMGHRGKVVNITGPAVTFRQSEFHAILPTYPEIELAYEDEGQWSRESGAQIMRAALAKHPDVRGVFAQNDHMACGAVEVLAEHGLCDQVVVVGFDADPEGLVGVHEGSIAATVARGLYQIGQTAVEVARRVGQGETLAPEFLSPTTLITAANLVDATLDTVYLLPDLLRELVASNRAQRHAQQSMIAVQQSLIRELSTPLIPINDSIMIMPLVGAIDSARAELIMTTLLTGVATTSAAIVILDITGVGYVDTHVANALLRASQAVKLLGAQVVLTGIRPEVAQTMVGLGISFKGIVTRSMLQDGITYALNAKA